MTDSAAVLRCCRKCGSLDVGGCPHAQMHGEFVSSGRRHPLRATEQLIPVVPESVHAAGMPVLRSTCFGHLLSCFMSRDK